MSKNFIKKNIKLSAEFDAYVYRNPDALKKIPRGAHIFITVKGDSNFNKRSERVAKETKEKEQKIIEARKEGRRWVLQPV